MKSINSIGKQKNRTKQQRPVYWKQVLVTTLTVYPLLLIATSVLKAIFPMYLLQPEAVIFFSVLAVASLMVFPVMPLVQKVLGSWLYKR